MCVECNQVSDRIEVYRNEFLINVYDNISMNELERKLLKFNPTIDLTKYRFVDISEN